MLPRARSASGASGSGSRGAGRSFACVSVCAVESGAWPEVILGVHVFAGSSPVAPTIQEPANRGVCLDNVGQVDEEAGVLTSSWRNVSTVCDDPAKRSPTSLEWVEDAFAARRYLSSLAFVDSSRIGLVGWSHGGVTAPPPDARPGGESGFARAAPCILQPDVEKETVIAQGLGRVPRPAACTSAADAPPAAPGARAASA
jgi:hypothetical protein